jgi:superfamily II DNA or RNA helicase
MLLELFRKRFARTPIGLDRDTAARGEAVFAAGKVLSVNESTPGQLQGDVEGSQGQVYQTRVTLAPHGAVVRVAGECTCPVGHNCKHSAAMVLAWLRDQDEVPAAPVRDNPVAVDSPTREAAQEAGASAPIPGYERLQVLHWVRGLRTLRLHQPASQPRSRLIYILRNAQRRPSLHVFRIRRGEDGRELSPEPYRGLSTQVNDPPSDWQEIDVMAAAMLQRFTPIPGGVLLDGLRGQEVLMQLARAGRLFLDEPPASDDVPALQAAEPRRSQLDWHAVGECDASKDGVVESTPSVASEASASMRLVLQIEGGGEPLYTAHPCWLDRRAGLIGPIADPPPGELIAWLRGAPAVPADSAEDVALALHAQLLARPDLKAVVPRLSSHPVREEPGVPRPVIGLFAMASAPAPRGAKPSSQARDRLAVSFAVEYGGRRMEPLRSASLGIRDEQGPVLILCDPVAERAALERLHRELQPLAADEPSLRLTPDLGADVQPARTRSSSGWLTVGLLPVSSIAAARIKFDVLERLKADGWAVVDESAVSLRIVQADSVEVDLKPAGTESAQADAPKGGWFELQSGIQIAGSRIDLAPVLAEVIARGGFDAWRQARCPDGVLWLRISQDEVLRIEAQRIEPLARVVTDWSEAMPGSDGEAPRLRIDAVAAAQIAARTPGLAVPPSLDLLRTASESFEALPEISVPASFRATLRPYQQQGLAWLQFIAGTATGGVLADDMGLGKTVQVLAHLECERAAGRMKRPVLVVAPTSLVFNWQDEAARHAPTLRVLALHGGARSQRFDEIDAHDIVLTSYALLPRDLEALGARRWHAVIADEAHLVKNSRTRAAAAIRSLEAGHRIALTGTPLENHLGELWSVMQFVVPGLLGREEAFRERFRTPIERRAGSPEALERLSALNRRIRPFLLRRTKAAVLTELPPRTDIVHRVELGREQRDLYESVRVAMDERVRLALADAGIERSRIVVLDALLKLRQACCDPGLLSMPAARKVTESAKLEALNELLEQLVDEGRRVLVFSQFTSMLDRIEQALDAHPTLSAVSRSRLDGDTVDRRAVVTAFQEGDAQVFLLSLKAGGVGLNLTAADTVIHYDPWWNPAVESQATDRAHRIGQQRAVFVYKLIAAGTIEERILELQSRKGALSNAVLEGALDGQGLSKDDLLGLFLSGA